MTVTLPGVRYGLVSAVLVVFALVITDFGVPKVVGGHYNVLATDVYKQVVGQQNFQMRPWSGSFSGYRPFWPSPSTASSSSAKRPCSPPAQCRWCR
jgi:hypothetical protein